MLLRAAKGAGVHAGVVARGPSLLISALAASSALAARRSRRGFLDC
jgi:hypothetical protein